MSDLKTNLSISVLHRIRSEARRQGAKIITLQVRYGLERFLYRLGRSEYRDRYLLKGAMLLISWMDMPFRQTQDLDLSSSKSFGSDVIEANIRDICSLSVEPDDGLAFRDDSLRIAPIRISEDFKGFRARLVWSLGKARIVNQIDIGFGDVVVPDSVDMDFPALLDMPPAHVRAYPRETVAAEKFSAIVSLGISNSRMKDFYDIWALSRNFEFDGSLLQSAVKATFERQRTGLPQEPPVGLRDDFAGDPERTAMWKDFLQRADAENSPSLGDVVAWIRGFLMPLARQEAGGLRWDGRMWRRA